MIDGMTDAPGARGKHRDPGRRAADRGSGLSFGTGGHPNDKCPGGNPCVRIGDADASVVDDPPVQFLIQPTSTHRRQVLAKRSSSWFVPFL